ncbi:MAG: lysophospholipid acyltransferase family protein, partial [Pseudomonadota bacterium]
FVCRYALRILGLTINHHGAPMAHPGAMVANHSSWLDIFALNSAGPLYFVSKSEVAQWPGIGWLARATGTVFVNRRAREAGTQKTLFEERLAAGHRLLFFPEGTSTDGQRVLPFKSTLFAGLISDPGLWVQPVTVVYSAPEGEDARFYGWWGDMDFAPHLAQVLAQAPQGRVDVIWHAPVDVATFACRKSLARHCEAVVSAGHSGAASS